MSIRRGDEGQISHIDDPVVCYQPLQCWRISMKDDSAVFGVRWKGSNKTLMTQVAVGSLTNVDVEV